MKEKDVDQSGSGPRPGALAQKGVQVLDACIGVLDKMRKRLQGTADLDESSSQSTKKSPHAANVDSAPPTAGPRQKSFLHRALIVLLSLLLGGGVGALVSYRIFSATIASHAAAIDQMQDEIDQSKKQEALNLNAKIRYQKEMNENRKALVEAQQEIEALKDKIEDDKRQVEELTKQLAATKKIERPPAKAGHAASPATAKRMAPQKSADCVTGTTNLTENLANCIDKFNRR
jgi:Tfp pilus assembly protein PilN